MHPPRNIVNAIGTSKTGESSAVIVEAIIGRLPSKRGGELLPRRQTVPATALLGIEIKIDSATRDTLCPYAFHRTFHPSLFTPPLPNPNLHSAIRAVIITRDPLPRT